MMPSAASALSCVVMVSLLQLPSAAFQFPTALLHNNHGHRIVGVTPSPTPSVIAVRQHYQSSSSSSTVAVLPPNHSSSNKSRCRRLTTTALQLFGNKSEEEDGKNNNNTAVVSSSSLPGKNGDDDEKSEEEEEVKRVRKRDFLSRIPFFASRADDEDEDVTAVDSEAEQAAVNIVSDVMAVPDESVTTTAVVVEQEPTLVSTDTIIAMSLAAVAAVTSDDTTVPTTTTTTTSKDEDTTTSTTLRGENNPTTTTPVSPSQARSDLLAVAKSDPLAYAKELQRQAAKVRLEAEKMDVTLTLQKISSLERQLQQATRSNSTDGGPEVVTGIQEQIGMLTQKLTTGGASSTSAATTAKNKSDETAAPNAVLTTVPTTLSAEELGRRTEDFLQTPKFLRDLTTRAAGFAPDFGNATAVVEKMWYDEQLFLRRSALDNDNPVVDGDGAGIGFVSDAELKEGLEQFSELPQFLQDMTAKTLGLYEKDDGKETNATAVVLAMKGIVAGNEEAIDTAAKNQLKSEKKKKKSNTNGGVGSSSLFGDSSSDDTTQEEPEEDDDMIESLFPKSTRKDGETPTDAQMERFYNLVLDQETFVPNGKPEPTLGGFFVRGENKKKNGDDLVTALDAAFEKSPLESSLSYFYVKDPTPVTEEQMMMGSRPPVLYITGKDVFKERNSLLSVVVTALGLAGVSFLSVYPFVLNDDISARIDEQVTLASSSAGGADLDFLSELTTPIVVTFIGIQLAHEAAHLAFAKLNGFDIAVPATLIPSPLLGITSTITALRSSPKNKQALFDFAIAGPLVGMALSIVAMYVGLQSTVALDTQAFNALPAMPVSFLQQSSLGGGIIEGVLGADTLRGLGEASSNPATATMHVHPLVIAGYASLMVNAFSLTPFGRTDGGRVALALFGRSGAQLTGLLTLGFLFFGGLFSSDAMLLYFGFILFYQNELEVPLRNEADDVDFGRALLAIASGVLVLLTIIPMSK